MTTPLYTIAVREGHDGIEHPDEALCTPTAETAVGDYGFIHHSGVYLTGVGEEDEPPAEFVALGHDHTWTAMCQAAAAFLKLHDHKPDTTGRRPLPERRHAIFLRHPHPDNPCNCAWDDSWRLVYVPDSTPGAIPVTVMRRGGE